MDIREASDEDLLEELEKRGFHVSIKVTGVDCKCLIGDKEFDVRAME